MIGVFDIRHLEESNYDDFAGLEVEDVVSPPLYVPESKNVDELLWEMRENRIHVVILIDEFGATESLMTVENLTKGIVGEILVGGEE